MYQDCENAKQSIEFEQYMLENDAVGRRFVELFIEKAKQGVNIFIICDAFGSASMRHSPLIQELRRVGGHVKFYNLPAHKMILTPWRWFPRTHIKTMLIDSAIAYIGGVCIAEYMTHWRDTHVRVEGRVTQQVAKAFEDLKQGRAFKKRKKTPQNAAQDFRYDVSQPLLRKRAVYQEFVKIINSAEHYIYITSAFFIPNRRFLKHIRNAARRGVEIKVIVPEHSDVPMADWLRLSYSRRYLKTGLCLFHYRQAILHSKTAIIDDKWATVGSTNFDVISFFHNREGNLFIQNRDAIAELKQHFSSDLLDSVEFTMQHWQKIPGWKKCIGYALRSVKAFFG